MHRQISKSVPTIHDQKAEDLYNQGLQYLNNNANELIALELYLIPAADRNYMPAVKLVKNLLWNGFKNIEKDREKALFFIKKLADAGSAEEIMQLAHGYWDGITDVLPKNRKAAIPYIKKLAESGDPWAQYQLGRLYYLGMCYDVPVNLEEARKWLKKAVSQDYLPAIIHVASIFNMGDIAGSSHVFPVNYDIAFKMYEYAASHQSVKALAMLAFMYASGRAGTDLSEAERIEKVLFLARLSLWREYPKGVIELSKLFQKGLYGCPKNEKIAHQLLSFCQNSEMKQASVRNLNPKKFR